MLRELKIIIDTQNCEDVVRFYGAIFQDVRLFKSKIDKCWISGRLLDCNGTNGLLVG